MLARPRSMITSIPRHACPGRAARDPRRRDHRGGGAPPGASRGGAPGAVAGRRSGAPPSTTTGALELRDAIAEAKPEDLAPLVEQMARCPGHRRASRPLAHAAGRPHVAVLRPHAPARERPRERDVLIGKRGFVTERGQSPAHRRLAQRAGVAGSTTATRRATTTRRTRPATASRGRWWSGATSPSSAGILRRIGCPQGTFVRDARGVWHEAEGQSARRCRAARAQPPPAAPGAAARQGRAWRPPSRHPPAGRCRAPTSTSPRSPRSSTASSSTSSPRPPSGLVLIQGGAGSGKTTVALHRVAYLNFSDPQRFEPRKMLVVVPSHALSQYVAGVLPSLGVRGVPVLTYRAWASGTRRGCCRDAAAIATTTTPPTRWRG